MLTIQPVALTVDAVDAAKTYLRLESDDEDSSVAPLLRLPLFRRSAIWGSC